MRYMPCDHPISSAHVAREGERNNHKWISLTCNMGFMGKATVHPSSLDLGGDGAVTQTFIYNYHKGGQEQIPL